MQRTLKDFAPGTFHFSKEAVNKIEPLLSATIGVFQRPLFVVRDQLQ